MDNDFLNLFIVVGFLLELSGKILTEILPEFKMKNELAAAVVGKSLWVFCILIFISSGFAQPVNYQGLNCYFGVMHAHSVLSPDFRPQPGNYNQFRQLAASTTGDERFQIQNGPFLAYKRAADAGKLDFLAITDHVHGPEGGEAEYCRHEMPFGGYRLIYDSASRINADPQYRGRFLAIPGMEWSTIGSGNHVNIFFARNPVPQNIPNGNFRALFMNYLTNPALEGRNNLLLVQMNHPNQDNYSTSYGRRDFPAGAAGYAQFAAFYRNTFLGIEHINNSSNGGNNNALEINAHQDGDGLARFYRLYLNMGFRLAPIGDHDNHRANWGRHTAARTGVWASEMTPAKFAEAYRQRRVYATEDNEMAVAFLSEGRWMGSVVRVPAAGQTRTFTVMVTQAPDTDTGQVQNEGPYIIQLFGDEDGAGGAEAAPVQFNYNGAPRSSIQIQQGQTVQLTYRVRPGSYFYLHVKETNGRDAGGQNADAWTAPIFFTN